MFLKAWVPSLEVNFLFVVEPFVCSGVLARNLECVMGSERVGCYSCVRRVISGYAYAHYIVCRYGGVRT